MKKAAILFLALLMAVLSAAGAEPAPDLESLELIMPKNSLTEQFEQEGAEGMVKVADLSGAGDSDDSPFTVEGFVPDDAEKMVIGRDDRIQVTNTAQYPFSAIANMKVTGECGDQWECTGFMVGKNFMLTAAHCMICPEHSVWARNFTFYFGYRDSSNYLYRYTGDWSAVAGTDFPDGYNFQAVSNDWCFIRLEKNVGEVTGWFGMRSSTDEEIGSGYYQVAGYRDNKLKYAFGNAIPYDGNIMFYEADDVPGNSGGPIYEEDYATGIIVAEDTESEINIGRRITRTLFDCMVENGFEY